MITLQQASTIERSVSPFSGTSSSYTFKGRFPSCRWSVSIPSAYRSSCAALSATGSIQSSKIVLVMDNLNTHSIASLYATFPPQYARAIAERLEIHYTPKHGSWLDIAEIELSALGRQCISNNRIPDLPSLRRLLKPWAAARNAAQRGVDWQFTTDDARVKLKHLYPIIKI